MVMQIKRFVLPTPTEFIRHISRILLLNQKNDRDTETVMLPVVTRAKTLTEREGIIVSTSEKEEN